MAPWAVAQGYGRQEDVSVMEEGGRLASADADLLSDRALERGLKQVGTLVRETISSKQAEWKKFIRRQQRLR